MLCYCHRPYLSFRLDLMSYLFSTFHFRILNFPSFCFNCFPFIPRAPLFNVFLISSTLLYFEKIFEVEISMSLSNKLSFLSFFSLHTVSSKTRTQTVRPGHKHLHLPSPLSGPACQYDSALRSLGCFSVPLNIAELCSGTDLMSWAISGCQWRLVLGSEIISLYWTKQDKSPFGGIIFLLWLVEM